MNNELKPWMDANEVAFIEKYLSKNDDLLEWGSGYSTIYFSKMVNTITSVEHEKQWYETIQNLIIREGVDNTFIFYHPLSDNDYIHFAEGIFDKNNKVLIDGRNRVKCAVALLDVIDENVIVFIHDWNRLYYKKVLEYYDIIEEISTGTGFVALKRKPCQ